MKNIAQKVTISDYLQKFSFSVVYAILASIAVNFFYQPGKIYSSGITGVAQIITTLSTEWFGFNLPVSANLLILNLPLFLVGWFKVGISLRFSPVSPLF